MLSKFSSNREFNKKKLYVYFFLTILVSFLFMVNSFLNIEKKVLNYCILAVLILMLFICIFLLIEFIRLIPKTTSSLTNICIGSGLLLCLFLITYANLYFQVYRLKGENAFNFTGDRLSGNDFLYFSITTFTTTGYGDITSIGLISNVLAASEMLIGMISNTILMAIITSKLIKKLGN